MACLIPNSSLLCSFTKPDFKRLEKHLAFDSLLQEERYYQDIILALLELKGGTYDGRLCLTVYYKMAKK